MLLLLILLAQAPQDRLSQWWIDVTQTGARMPNVALPDVLSGSPAATDGARTVSDVLWSDLKFAGLFGMVDKKSYPPGAVNPASVDYYRWEAAGADLLIYARAETTGVNLSLEVRLFGVQSKTQLFGTRYEGTLKAARTLAHFVADDILAKLANYPGVSQTKIAFTSDRACERCKEIYVIDYDGFAPSLRALTANRSLNLSPAWSPDGQVLAYVSLMTGRSDIFRAFIQRGGSDGLVEGPGSSRAPSWSPDGKQLAFASTRDGNDEIYVMNADGSGVRRLTRHDGIDTAPSWSPNGREIVFTSDRTGSPQIYVMDSDGLNLRQISFEGKYNDGAVWSPARRQSEIVWASRIEKGAEFSIDIVSLNLATNQIRQLTTGRGINESPSWSPNGEHIAFASNRTGSSQIFTMRRDGTHVQQVTREGNNTMPKWGPRKDERRMGLGGGAFSPPAVGGGAPTTNSRGALSSPAVGGGAPTTNSRGQ